MTRSIAAIVCILALGCHGPTPAPVIANRAAPQGSCPDLALPFTPAEPIALDQTCTHGQPVPMLLGPAEAPSCHGFRANGATGSIETLVVGGRRFWLEQSGCEHATFQVVTSAAGSRGLNDRATLIRRAGALLVELGAVTTGWPFQQFGADLIAAAAGAPVDAFPIGAGDWTATVEVVEGQITVTLDFPL